MDIYIILLFAVSGILLTWAKGPKGLLYLILIAVVVGTMTLVEVLIGKMASWIALVLMLCAVKFVLTKLGWYKRI